eukprot:Mrub_08642.p2 GENE.Mrub_08642~~Mrub_08642.p2  ORF type:complete len:210 (-),score=42.29 Mrub_08642:187-816(-)
MIVTAAYFMRRFRWSYAKALHLLKFRKPGLQMKAGYIEQLNKYEQRFNRKGEQLSNTWKLLQIDDASNEYDEVIVTNKFINAEAKSFAEYNLSENQYKIHKMKWTYEVKGKVLIVCYGLAASVKNNHQMNNTFTYMSRIEETSATARGPHNPLAISQSLKLKSLLKGSTGKYVIVRAKVTNKLRRPMSSSTVSKRPMPGDREMNYSFVG